MQAIFLRLLLGTVAILAFGYAGGAKFMNPWLGFALGMAGWVLTLITLFEVCGKDPNVNQYVREAFSTMRFFFIISVRRSIYPFGYFFS